MAESPNIIRFMDGYTPLTFEEEPSGIIIYGRNFRYPTSYYYVRNQDLAELAEWLLSIANRKAS